MRRCRDLAQVTLHLRQLLAKGKHDSFNPGESRAEFRLLRLQNEQSQMRQSVGV